MSRPRGWVLGILLISLQAAAVEGPHGGQLLIDGRSQYELMRSKDTGQVIFYALNSAEPLPDRISLTLYSGPGKVQQINLRSVNPSYEPYARYESYDPGKVSPMSESFTGVELSFGVGAFPRSLYPLG